MKSTLFLSDLFTFKKPVRWQQHLKTPLKSRVSLSEVTWYLRCFIILALFCNTLFVGMGIVIIPFLVTEPMMAITVILVVMTTYSVTYWGDPATTGSRRWELFRNGFVMKDIIRWFDGELLKTCELESGKQYLFGLAPHGIMPASSIWMTIHPNWNKFFPGIEAVTLGASVMHYAPLIRDLAMWAGTRQITKTTFQNVIDEGKSIVMIPGGVAELRLSNSLSNTIELCGKHQGFIKMAIKNGLTLVPSFAFGETLVFDALHVPFLSYISFKYLRMPFPYFTGLAGFWQIPRREKVTVVVGKPIEVERDENPPEEKIKEIHKLFYQGMRDVFEENKERCGHKGYKLKILNLD
jgi:hypothetical protein